MKLVNVEEMRRIEQAADAQGHSYAAMMDMAGHAVAEAALSLMLTEPDQSALVLVGPGNNGGDGLVAARYLMEAGIQITLYIWRRDIKGDKNFQRLKRSGRRSGLSILWAENDQNCAHLREQLQTVDLVIDALLGTGVSRPIDGRLAEILTATGEEISQRRLPPPPLPVVGRPLSFPIGEAYTLGVQLPHRHTHGDEDDDFDFDLPEIEDDEELATLSKEMDAGDEYPDLDDWDDFDDYDGEDEGDEFNLHWPAVPVLAVDCPSGLNSDTGALDPATLPAQMTVTFAYPKWGQVEYPGAGACGVLAVADIGIPPESAAGLSVDLIGPAEVRTLLPQRPPDANKGTFGRAMIAAGSLNYSGAAHLSAAAASRSGAGLVTLAIPAGLHPALVPALPEITWLPLPERDGTQDAAGAPVLVSRLAGYRSLLVGPGLTREPGAVAFVSALFGPEGLLAAEWQGRLVADADCLNILSDLPDWPARLPAGTILTPHPGEMARLTGLPIAEINGQRIALARQYAAQWGHIVLLKGAHTVIAAPEGRAAVLPFETPALATAGSGDVLAGAIVAMLAQGLPAYEAAVCAAYVHGHAGLLVQREIGLAGGVAGDICTRLPHALRQLSGG